jgi:transposase
MRTPGTAAELERRRRLAVHRLQDGWKPTAVAQFLEVHIRTVRYWWAAYKRHGDAGLASKPQPGRPSKLTSRQVRQVLCWFRKNPRSFGFATELWTARRVAQVIERKWGVRYNHRYLNGWLTARDITPQKPQRKAREADQKTIDHWRHHEWPRLQNGRAANGPLLSCSTKAGCS